MNHHDILRREWGRIAAITDAVYQAMLPRADNEEATELPRLGDKFGMAAYKEWASLLLRFHDAIERISEGEGGVGDIPPMKAEPSQFDQEAADDLQRREAGPV